MDFTSGWHPQTPLYLLTILFSLIFHDIAHTLVARRLGDPTPLVVGRALWSPTRHFDFVGLIVMPVLGALSGFQGWLAWTKHLVTDSVHYEHPRLGLTLVSLAGPLANLLLVFLAAIGLLALDRTGAPAWIFSLLRIIGRVNGALIIINLIPIPPFDGGTIVAKSLLPRKVGLFYYRFWHPWFVSGLAILFYWAGWLQWIAPAARTVFAAVLGICHRVIY